MKLQTIEIDPAAAREALIEYRRSLREPARQKLGEAEREYAKLDAAMKRGYRELAAGRQLIELSTAITAGGIIGVDCRVSRWSEQEKRSVETEITVEAPALAVCRADARTCWTKGIDRDGAVSFHANDWHGGWGKKADKIHMGVGTFEPDRSRTAEYLHTSLRAIVPTVPPPFRPPHSLKGYHVLWEAEWNAAAPIDPALLKHLGGDLYAVLAVWDLTPLERAVLSGQRAED